MARAKLGRADFFALLASLPSDRTTLSMAVIAAREFNPRLSMSAINRAIFDSERDGEVQFQRHPEVDDDLICFTPLGAHRAQIHLSEDSTQWVRDDAAEVIYRVPSSLLDSDGLAWNLIERRVPEPLERVISFEDQDSTDVKSSWPILLGLTCPVPMPRNISPRDCPFHDRDIPDRRREYCLWCDASYFHHGEIPRIPRVLRPPE